MYICIRITNKRENYEEADKITREEFVTLIVNAFAKDAEIIEPIFEDVDSGAWYYEFIQKAKKELVVVWVLD